MGDTIEVFDIEIELKDYRKRLLEKKIGVPDCKTIEEMSKLGLNKI